MGRFEFAPQTRQCRVRELAGSPALRKVRSASDSGHPLIGQNAHLCRPRAVRGEHFIGGKRISGMGSGRATQR